MNDCPECGKPLTDQDRTCAHCGASPGLVGGSLADGGTGIFPPPEPITANKTEIYEAPGWSRAITPQEGIAGSRQLGPGFVLGGRYEILKALGEGGMGAVYQAHDTEVERIVALKMIREDLAGSADMLRRFRQELVLARQITHRNVVRIFDIGVADGERFISMEFIEGRELAGILEEKGRLDPREAAQIMVQVCEGLAAAHAQGVIHRDLKPQNIMIDQQGRAAVMDFGIAHSTDVSSLKTEKSAGTTMPAHNLTHMGAVLGTPQYMSPEQARGEEVDARSDLFTVGLILYELTTGELPPMGRTLKAILRDRGSKQIPPPIEIAPDLPKKLNRMIHRCLQLDPAKRYHSAHELAIELEIWLGLRKRHQASWRLVAAMVGLIVALAGGLIYALRPRTSATHAPVKVLIADWKNETGNAVLNGTIEPELGTLLEGAPFITAYNRGDAHKTVAAQSGGSVLDENAARLIAQREGVNVVISGSIARDGKGYQLRARAIDSRTTKPISEAKVSAGSAKELNSAVARVAARFRKALGDVTPQSEQMAAAETFSSESLEASQKYSLGQEMQWKGKWDDALKAYAKSAELDPNLGRAYAGMAVIDANMGRRPDAEKNFKLAMSKIDRMTDREKYRTRGAYYLFERNYDKAIEQFKGLEKQYPSDTAGIANLALAYFYERNMTAAMEEGKRALAIYPQNLLQMNNLGLYAMYAGDFATAIGESQKLIRLNPSFEKAYLCMGIAQLAQGDGRAAAETYGKAAGLSAWGASAAATGLADMALYEGRWDDALSILEKGIAADTAAHDSARALAKVAMTAEAWTAKGRTPNAIAAAERASASSADESLLYPAAMVLIDSGKADEAMALSRKLSERLSTDAAAYGKLIEAEALLKQNRVRDAARVFQEANKIADTWLGRFGLARAYLAAGAFTEADAELDACVKRRGEAAAVFLDDEPSWRYFATVNYYRGRAREGLLSPGAADAYRTFLEVRGRDKSAVMVKDAVGRLKGLGAGH